MAGAAGKVGGLRAAPPGSSGRFERVGGPRCRLWLWLAPLQVLE